jgi:hypothetical protein
VCFVVGRSALDHEAEGLSPFLTYWGGEALRGGLGLEMCAGELHVYRRIAAANVVAVWQPGDPDYDRHAALPGD